MKRVLSEMALWLSVLIVIGGCLAAIAITGSGKSANATPTPTPQPYHTSQGDSIQTVHMEGNVTCYVVSGYQDNVAMSCLHD